MLVEDLLFERHWRGVTEPSDFHPRCELKSTFHSSDVSLLKVISFLKLML